MKPRADAPIAALDGLRALACLIVFAAHNGAHEWYIVATSYGKLGVMFFFTLSGFLMGYHYIPERNTLTYWLAFLTRRFFRIYPAFAFSLLVLWIIGCITEKPFFANFTADAVTDHLLLLKGIGTYWSVAPEVKFYMLFPFIAGALALCTPHAKIWLVALLWVMSLSFAQMPQTDFLSILGYCSFFLAGVASAILYTTYNFHYYMNTYFWNAMLIICLTVAFTAVPYLFVLEPGQRLWVWAYAPFYSPLIALLILCVIHSTGLISMVFANRFSRFIGKISFSFYLIHLAVISRSVLNHIKWIPLSWFNLTLTLVLSYLMYRFIEAPGNRLGKYLASKIEHQHS